MKSAVLIRHSIRDKITDETLQAQAMLNEKGIRLAGEYGKELAKSYSKIVCYCSTIPRCRQTADLIAGQFKSYTGKIEETKILVNPFVFDDSLASESFHNLKTAGVVEALEEGQNLPGMHSLADGSKILLDYLRNTVQKSQEDELTLFVSHDMATILLINFLLGEKFTKDNHWLGYLGGIKIEFGEDSLSVKRIAGYER